MFEPINKEGKSIFLVNTASIPVPSTTGWAKGAEVTAPYDGLYMVIGYSAINVDTISKGYGICIYRGSTAVSNIVHGTMTGGGGLINILCMNLNAGDKVNIQMHCTSDSTVSGKSYSSAIYAYRLGPKS